MEEAAQQAAHVLAKLAADEVQGLDAVGALVDLRDARVAHELLHAVLADVAVAAVDLHAEIGDLEAGIGEEGFDDRRHQRDEVRSEERSVGKECVHKLKTWCEPETKKK